MYARTRADTDTRLNIPENYDGTAFIQAPSEPPPPQERNIRILGECSADAKMSPQERHAEPDGEAVSALDSKEAEKSVKTFSLFDKLPFATTLGRWRELPVLGQFFPSKIGTEEILIIATALFLLFSKSGDKECAIMLGLLLFVAK